MRERRIETITPTGKLRKVNETFISNDFLTQKDIDKMAETIVDSILEKIGTSSDQEVEIVVGILQPGQIVNYYPELARAGFSIEEHRSDDPISSIRLGWKDEKGSARSDTITRQELEPFLQKIRIAVLNKLSAILPDKVIAQIVKRNVNGKVLELEEGKFYKSQIYDRGAPEAMNFDTPENNDQVRALKHLHGLPERNTFIYYGTESLDPRNGRTIVKAIDLTDLEKVLRQKEKPEFSRILGYFIDVVEGHIFLLSNNLILTDNHLSNLGIEKRTDRGILFDFGGLRQKNDNTPYIAHIACFPPEQLRRNIVSPATEANIVYELGLGLGKIRRIYDRQEIPLSKKAALGSLSAQMTDINPEQRPTLEEVKSRLESIKMAA